MTLARDRGDRARAVLTTVIGDAGVGKSRLVREFAARASNRGRSRVLRGRCLPYGDGVTFWPIAEIVRERGRHQRRRPTGARAGEDRWRSLAGPLDRRTIWPGSPIGSAPRSACPRHRSRDQNCFGAIRKLFEALGEPPPLVAIIDDIHCRRADLPRTPRSPRWTRCTDAPVLLLATARRELLETRTEWADGHEAAQMILEPLSGRRRRP